MMKTLWYLSFLVMMTIIVLAAIGVPGFWIIGAGLIGIGILAMLLFSTVLPVKKAAIGIELLKGEEYNNRLTPSRDPGANRIVKVFNNLMDRLSEERLRLSETNNLLSLLVNASPLGVAIMDFDDRITLTNGAFREITGLREGAMLKKGDRVPLPEGDTEIYRVTWLTFMEKGFLRPFILIERLTEEVRQAEKEAYGKVVRTISHEVNNTIGALSSFMETLSDTPALDEDIRELALSCHDGCSHLVNFIRGYADVVRIGEPVKERIDYNDEIRKEMPFLRAMVSSEKTKIEVKEDLCDEGILIEADRSMLRQTLLNIVKNAKESILETGQQEGYIIIRTAHDKEGCILEIEDNGGGISEGEAHKIFRPFHTSKRNGQGLGLTLTAEILRRHGYRFSLGCEGGRTIFRIRI